MPPKSSQQRPHEARNIASAPKSFENVLQQFNDNLHKWRTEWRACTDPDDRNIRHDQTLEEDDIILGIACVAEALSLHGDQGVQFSLYDNYQYAQAVHSEGFGIDGKQGDTDVRVVRNKREILFPWFHGEHVFLVRARPVKEENGNERPVIEYYDTSPPRDFSVLNTIHGKVEMFLRCIRWWTGPDGTRAQEDMVVFRHFLKPARQLKSTREGLFTTCGAHVILNAWTLALGLTPSTIAINHRALTGAPYETIVEVIKLAILGFMNGATISKMLFLTRWADPRQQVPGDRRFGSTWKLNNGNALREHRLMIQVLSASDHNETLAEDNDSGKSHHGKIAGEGKERNSPKAAMTMECAQCPVPGHCPTLKDLAGTVVVSGSAKEPACITCTHHGHCNKADSCTYYKKRLELARRKSGVSNPISSISIRETDVISGIMSVTEAICSAQSETVFSLYDYRLWAGHDKFSQCIRPRQNLLFPWRYEGGLDILVNVQADKDKDNNDELVIKYYHCSPNGEPDDQIENDVLHFITRIGWWRDPKDPEKRLLLPEYAQHHWKTTALRRNDEAGPIHVILNAWTIALGFEPSDDRVFPIPASNYGDAAEAIDLAINGWMNTATIYALLRCWKFIHDRDEEKTVPENRHFARTVKCSKENDLHAYTTAKRDEESGRVNDNRTANDKGDGGSAGEGNEDNEQQSCISPRKPRRCIKCPLRGHCSSDGSGAPKSRTADRVGATDENMSQKDCVICPVSGHCDYDDALYGKSPCDSLWEFVKATQDYFSNVEYQEFQKVAARRTYRPRLISHDVQLSEEDIILGIASVTEAISMNGAGKQFSLYDDTSFSCAKLDFPMSLQNLALRPRRQLLFPWVISELEDMIEGTGGDRNRDTEALKERFQHVADTLGHIIVVDVQYVESAETSLGKPKITIYESATRYTLTERKGVEVLVERIVNRLKWWNGPFADNDMPAAEFVWAAAKQQMAPVVCGIHATLNAWAIALGLNIRTDGQEIPIGAYAYAARVITLAVHGAASSEAIYALLRCIQWVTDDPLPRDRRFQHTFHFDSWESLQRRLIGQMEILGEEDPRYLELSRGDAEISREISGLQDRTSEQLVELLHQAGHRRAETYHGQKALEVWQELAARQWIRPWGTNVPPSIRSSVQLRRSSTPRTTHLLSPHLLKPLTYLERLRSLEPIDNRTSPEYRYIERVYGMHNLHKVKKEKLKAFFKDEEKIERLTCNQKRIMVDAAEYHFREVKKRKV